MLQLAAPVLWLTALTAALPSSQHVLDLSFDIAQGGNTRKLHGKFLHITDIHPDPFYKIGSDPSGDHPCHKGKGQAGFFGAEKTDCDSPFSLVNATFDWIKANLKDDIDFVVWTGDSARHDNDEQYPRTDKQVEELNQFIVAKFDEVFGKPDNRDDPDPTNDFVVPIVPTFGNNDILPHNIFEPGPNKWTRKYLKIWEMFIPQQQRHSFARGGYFFYEVIPNRLAVFSLNTMYFFDSNGAVDGCDDPNEPGYDHFEWLRVQLQFLRERKMKAILMGHVPPARTDSKQNWEETCYQKYTLWLRQFRDVIIGNLFGHMNIDHFMLQDVNDLNYKFDIDGIDDGFVVDEGKAEDDIRLDAKSDYLSDLRQMWSNLPAPPKSIASSISELQARKAKSDKEKKQLDKYLKKIGGPFGERFSLSLVSPSVVPNYYPTLRIIKYNMTGLEHDHPATNAATPLYRDAYNGTASSSSHRHVEDFGRSGDANGEPILEEGDDVQKSMTKKKKKHKKKKGKKQKPNFPVPEPPSKTASPGPAYSPQTFSLISWRQLYANLTRINANVAKELKWQPVRRISSRDVIDYEEMFKKHFYFEQEYHTKDDKVYHMEDLTMRSWLDLAEKIGRTTYQPSMEATKQEEVSSYLDTEAEVNSLHLSSVHFDFDDIVRVLTSAVFEKDLAEKLEGIAGVRWKKYQPLPRPNMPGDPSWPDWLVIALDEKVKQLGNSPDTPPWLVERHHDDEGITASESEEDSPHSDGAPEYSSITKMKHEKGVKWKNEILKRNHLWHAFVKRAFVGSKLDDELEDEFG